MGFRSRSRFAEHDEEEAAGGDRFECTGATCRSCTAVVVADCIAIGCCPCAVVNMLALTLVKVPWVVARRCLGTAKRKLGRPFRRRRRVVLRNGGVGGVEMMSKAERVEMMKRDDEVRGILGMRAGEMNDKVWMEFYQIGQWGFGRLSLSGMKAWECGA
ncbi:hypothetical protein Cni_G23253 [Canna indica]|uniref:Uncharacterized protein n=1 Tax=Canna indica TaxID=4628 RepID=A0AAQ3QM30_9LILI|nr:hypothetical protein Cni_G23253 [Canna indica]